MEEIKKYYPNVITMETFMTELAPLYWKEGNRFAYCSSGLADNNDGKCTRVRKMNSSGKKRTFEN